MLLPGRGREKGEEKETRISGVILTMRVLKLQMSQDVDSVYYPWQIKIHLGLLFNHFPNYCIS